IFFMGILLFSFGVTSVSYGIIVLIIRVSLGFTGTIGYVKDMGFDLVFLLLGFLLIKKNNNPNPPKRQYRR
ncbi:MAG: hypothetical protein ACFE8B_14535, partial [Candidatus Hermodarchaeota archaeon]